MNPKVKRPTRTAERSRLERGFIAAAASRADHRPVDRTVASRQRRLATAALWVLTIWSGSDIVSLSRGLSWGFSYWAWPRACSSTPTRSTASGRAGS